MADRRPWSEDGRKEPERQGLAQAKPLERKEWTARELGQRLSFGVICGAIMGAMGAWQHRLADDKFCVVSMRYETPHALKRLRSQRTADTVTPSPCLLSL